MQPGHTVCRHRPRWLSLIILTNADIKISMDGRGRYLDNIFIERLWRSLKQEAVYLHEITDGFQAKRIIDVKRGAILGHRSGCVLQL